MALKLSLRPGEKFVINGAVVANGDRRASLVIKNRASILRERDIMQASEATTPARRIYFAIMMMYIEEGNKGQAYEEFVMRMTEFLQAVSSSKGKALCLAISKHVMDGQYYKGLTTCRELIEFEDERLGNVAGVPAGAESDV
jgi:flagellar protein FlbT